VLIMRRQRGISLIEVSVALLIISLVLAKSIPGLLDYVRNDRVRAVAEEMRDGLHTARLEAIRRNTTVNFVPAGAAWAVVVPGVNGLPDETLQQRRALASDAKILANASAPTVAFNGSGRLTGGAFSVDVASNTNACVAGGGDVRCLRVTVAPGGMIRMCDPAVVAPAPQAC
jgi:type IV fimbrial biogenesis protein FimT